MKITPINPFSTIHCGQHMARNAVLSLTSLHVLMLITINYIAVLKIKLRLCGTLLGQKQTKHDNKDEIQLNIEGKSVTDSYKLANIFNDYFANATYTTQSENYDHPPSALDSLHSSCTKSFSQIHMTPVSANEIKDIIKSLKMKNSCGYDEVPLKIFKISLPYIVSPLTYLCNRSRLSGKFPTWLKYAQIVPVFKKGDKEQPTNYRPKSLLTLYRAV